MTSIDELVAQLRALGVREGGVLLVHTSFRAVRPVEAGPLGLIRALARAVGPRGTLVMPTMTDGESVFDPRTTPTCGMGITAESFWRQPNVLRSTHPGGSFAALGPDAGAICAEQPLSPPHGPDSPVGRVHDLDGQILLLGVTHSENTTLHLAEALAAVPCSVAHPCVIAEGETVSIPETDHCCEGFKRADAWLRATGAQREGRIGNATARLVAARAVVTAALLRLATDKTLFLCRREAACAECTAAWASVRA